MLRLILVLTGLSIAAASFGRKLESTSQECSPLDESLVCDFTGVTERITIGELPPQFKKTVINNAVKVHVESSFCGELEITSLEDLSMIESKLSDCSSQKLTLNKVKAVNTIPDYYSKIHIQSSKVDSIGPFAVEDVYVNNSELRSFKIYAMSDNRCQIEIINTRFTGIVEVNTKDGDNVTFINSSFMDDTLVELNVTDLNIRGKLLGNIFLKESSILSFQDNDGDSIKIHANTCDPHEIEDKIDTEKLPENVTGINPTVESYLSQSSNEYNYKIWMVCSFVSISVSMILLLLLIYTLMQLNRRPSLLSKDKTSAETLIESASFLSSDEQQVTPKYIESEEKSSSRSKSAKAIKRNRSK